MRMWIILLRMQNTAWSLYWHRIVPCHSVWSIGFSLSWWWCCHLGWSKQAGWKSTCQGLRLQDWAGNIKVEYRQRRRNNSEVWKYVFLLEKQREADLVNCCAFYRSFYTFQYYVINIFVSLQSFVVDDRLTLSGSYPRCFFHISGNLVYNRTKRK